MLGMPRMEIEFEFDMVFCFGIHLAPYAVFFLFFHFFHSDLPSTHCTDRPINIVFVCPSVRPFFRSQFMNLGP